MSCEETSSDAAPSVSPNCRPLDDTKLTSFQPAAPALVPLFRCECTVGSVHVVGQTSVGMRKIIPLESAVLTSSDATSPFHGARLLEGGAADYLRTDAEGTAWLDARYAFLLRSGRTLYVQSSGTRYGHSAEAGQKLLEGKEEVEVGEYCFRLRLILECEDEHEEIRKACKSLVIASAVRGTRSVVYDAYLVQ
ncbi:hypothetical protein IE81DRAFT_311334 [Ceraceosorus guamensis]|uniref:Uncharacterized protein n=1 Tax=Ceraceosorus guamensis TaxID=1522189 RepID=A0A316W453_9BASI|nr:hypothetical protein IE81DRAFT_311334 [Ceraceosorus guamensis]PWN43898.1 hypothetical protein IE81DRAFT_311334 [Ceraceosorus guamensis]